MRSVWKFSLPINVMSVSFTNSFQVPIGARLVHVREQYQTLAMWFEVDPNAKTEKRSFQIFGTGHGDIREGLEYVGSGVFDNDELVLHVYEVKDDMTSS